MYGAEHLLCRRARDERTTKALLGRIQWWERHDAALRAQINNNPTPGNILGGITTTLISEQSAEQFKQSGRPVTLFLYDFYRQSQAVLATAMAQDFRPEWLDEDTLAYDDPAGPGRVIRRLAPPLPGNASSRAELEAELLVQDYITETQAIDWAGAGYQAVIYRPADDSDRTYLPNHLVIYKSQAEETVILGHFQESQQIEFASLADQETPAGWLDMNGDGRLELPQRVGDERALEWELEVLLAALGRPTPGLVAEEGT